MLKLISTSQGATIPHRGNTQSLNDLINITRIWSEESCFQIWSIDLYSIQKLQIISLLLHTPKRQAEQASLSSIWEELAVCPRLPLAITYLRLLSVHFNTWWPWCPNPVWWRFETFYYLSYIFIIIIYTNIVIQPNVTTPNFKALLPTFNSCSENLL